jgi:hypothetical protein
MTNLELDKARVDEAFRLYETMDWPDGVKGDTRECYVAFIREGIKRGRELERAEAQPTFFDALTANSALCRAEEMIRSARRTLEIITQPEGSK